MLCVKKETSETSEHLAMCPLTSRAFLQCKLGAILRARSWEGSYQINNALGKAHERERALPPGVLILAVKNLFCLCEQLVRLQANGKHSHFALVTPHAGSDNDEVRLSVGVSLLHYISSIPHRNVRAAFTHSLPVKIIKLSSTCLAQSSPTPKTGQEESIAVGIHYEKKEST